MHLTNSDYLVWERHNLPNKPPAWAARFIQDCPDVLDRAINGHAVVKVDTVSGNAIVLLKMAKKRLGSYRKYLLTEYSGNWDKAQNFRRYRYYKKWADRLLKEVTSEE